jgi:hypothetical protein
MYKKENKTVGASKHIKIPSFLLLPSLACLDLVCLLVVGLCPLVYVAGLPMISEISNGGMPECGEG